jgi:DNA-binding transcriptional MerR regulator
MADLEIQIPEKERFKIGEVCRLTDTQPYVLRFWESEFPSLAPQKTRSGQRIYRREDIEMVLRIKELLYEESYTIAGARKQLENADSGPAIRSRLRPPARVAKAAGNGRGDDSEARARLDEVRTELQELLDLLK